MFWFTAFVIGTIYGVFFETTDDGWAKWWLFNISVTAVVCGLALILYLCGGVRDIRDLFRALKTAKRNALDDGSVEAHHNVADDSVPSDTTCQKDSEKTVNK